MFQHPAFPLAARLLMVALFLPAGLNKITGFEGTVGYIASVGLPLAGLGAVVAIVVEVGASLALLAGFATRWAALALALFTLGASVFFHNYWAMPAEQQFVQQLITLTVTVHCSQEAKAGIVAALMRPEDHCIGPRGPPLRDNGHTILLLRQITTLARRQIGQPDIAILGTHHLRTIGRKRAIGLVGQKTCLSVGANEPQAIDRPVHQPAQRPRLRRPRQPRGCCGGCRRWSQRRLRGPGGPHLGVYCLLGRKIKRIGRRGQRR